MDKGFAQMRDLVHNKAAFARDILSKRGVQLKEGGGDQADLLQKNVVQGWHAKNNNLELTLTITAEKDNTSTAPYPELQLVLIDYETKKSAIFFFDAKDEDWTFFMPASCSRSKVYELFKHFEPKLRAGLTDEEFDRSLSKLAHAFLQGS